jgi:hypothetical protein
MKSLRDQAIDNRKYPDGTKIPKNLPPKYSLAKGNEKCSNCEYYMPKTRNCTKWDAIVRPAYWCAKWEPKEAE